MSCTFLWRCDMVTWNMFAPAGSTGAAKILFKRIHWWFPDGCRLDPGHNSGDQWNKCGLMSTYQNPGSRLTIAIFANTVNSPFLKVLFFADESWGAMLAVVRKLQAIKASEETQRVSKGTLWWKGFDGIWMVIDAHSNLCLGCIYVYLVMLIPKPGNCWNLWDLSKSFKPQVGLCGKAPGSATCPTVGNSVAALSVMWFHVCSSKTCNSSAGARWVVFGLLHEKVLSATGWDVLKTPKPPWSIFQGPLQIWQRL